MDREDGKRLTILQTLGRYKYVFLVAVVGAIMLLWPWQEGEVRTETTVQHMTGENDVSKLEKQMEDILSKMNGVGRVDVLLTLESGGELVLATDSTLRYRGSPQNPDDYDRSTETVTVSGGNGTDVVVTQERSAKFRGALIVCEGGDNDRVRLSIVEAVCALTGLGADRVAVVRWGSSEAGAQTTGNSGEELA